MTDKSIVIWQRILTPHMTYLAEKLFSLGYDVTYATESFLSEEREKQGWVVGEVHHIKICFIKNKQDIESLIYKNKNAFHICQGFRGNGYVGDVQKCLKYSGIKYFVIMENIVGGGLIGVMRRILYYFTIKSKARHVRGVMAIGGGTKRFISSLGFDGRYIFDFAYFVDPPPKCDFQGKGDVVHFIYVGQLIERKRVDLLIKSLSLVADANWCLSIIGQGNLEGELKKLTDFDILNRINWLGVVPINKVKDYMKRADCLVLPSAHDGWGVVISEALLSGTRVICSDGCGASVVVQGKKNGYVFARNNIDSLVDAISRVINDGPLNSVHKRSISEWAFCLSAEAGAVYLNNILNYCERGGGFPVVPWEGEVAVD